MTGQVAARRQSNGLKAYKAAEATRSAEERDAEICKHLPLVHSVAERLAVNLPSHVDREDLFHSGVIGLIDAVDRFDPGKETAFSTYAVLRIRGAIIDELRSRDWVPRGARARAKDYQAAISDLHADLGRMPDDQEVAKRLGVELTELHDIERDAHLACQISLEATVGDSTTLGEVLAPTERVTDNPARFLEQADREGVLRQALSTLKEQERLIIKLYYFEGLLMREIADVLGKTESRICQIHGRLMAILRHRLGDLDG